MREIEQIFNKVLQNIQPTEKELSLIDSIVQKLTKLLKTRADALNIQYTDIEPQGSTGIKQTQLRNDFDIDLFIGLDYEWYKEKYKGLNETKFKKAIKKEFTKLCKEWIIEALNPAEFKDPRLLYAEHPYVTVDYITSPNRFEIDIVVYFDVSLDYIRKHGPITAVDRTPHHSRFIKKHLSEKQKNDVRLLKQFFKACYSYGDKSPVGRAGFIGYSAELLLYHFNDLLSVFKNFQSLPDNPLDFFGRKEQELRTIPHFRKDWLLLIDPIDENRNVASAISKRAFDYCNYNVNRFLKHPEELFFEIKTIPEFKPKPSKELDSHLFVMEFTKKDPEVHYTVLRDKLYSLGDYIVSHGEKEYDHSPKFGTIIFEVYFNPDKGEYNLALYCEHPVLDKYYERRGPPLRMEKDVQKFRKKHENCFSRDGFLWVRSKRDCQKFIEFLKTRITSRIPKSLNLENVSRAINTQRSSGRKALYVLKHMVLPFKKM